MALKSVFLFDGNFLTFDVRSLALRSQHLKLFLDAMHRSFERHFNHVFKSAISVSTLDNKSLLETLRIS
jgi:hypothetical protein